MHSEVDGLEHTMVHRLCENGPSTVCFDSTGPGTDEQCAWQIGELLPVFLASFHQKYGKHVGPSLEAHDK